MKQLLTLLLALFFSSALSAQTPNWAFLKTLNTTGSDGGGASVADGQGNIYVSATTGFGKCLIKYSSAGDIIWIDTVFGGGWLSINSVKFDRSGNLLIAGAFNTSVNIGAITYRDQMFNFGHTYVAKLDTNGTCKWIKGYGGTMDMNGMGVDAKDNIYLNTYFRDHDSTGAYELRSKGESDIAFTKLDSSGNVLWVKTMGGIDADATTGISVKDADVYLTGYYFSDTLQLEGETLVTDNNHNIISSGDGDIFLIKYDTSGQFGWAKTIGGHGHDLGIALGTDNFGNVFLGGNFTDSADFDGHWAVNPKRRLAPFVAKFKRNGAFSWVSSLNGKGNYIAETESMAIDSFGNLYATGTLGDSTTIQSVFIKDKGLFAAKWDSAGRLTWITSVKYAAGGGVCTDGRGNIYVTGSYSSSTNFGTINVSNSGNDEDMFFGRLSEVTGIPAPNAPNSAITVWPNPSTGAFNVKYKAGDYNSLNVYDINGKVIFHQEIIPASTQSAIHLPNCAAGVYVIQVRGVQNTASHPIIVQQ